MKCTELQSRLPFFADRSVAEDDRAAIDGHLKECPLCRQKIADFREIQNSLRALSRVEISDTRKNSLKRAVVSELRASKTSSFSVRKDLREWLTLGLLPYGVGALASLAIGLTFISLMYSGIEVSGPSSAFVRKPMQSQVAPLLASNRNPLQDGNSLDLTAPDYATSRADVGSESPSVNPQGALIALTKSLVRGGMKDDEVVVVADVFGNGLAQIQEVVEPSRDRNAVNELQKALDSDPAYAPFVAANLDKRSDNVRVVLKFQSVDVSTGQKKRKH